MSLSNNRNHIIRERRFNNELKLFTDITRDGKEPVDYLTAIRSDVPGEELVWYFLMCFDDEEEILTSKGKVKNPYKGGEYIGKIEHSAKYPIEAPSYYMLTPNGRFHVDRKICLSNSKYHAETWNSSWNLLTILIGFCSIWHDNNEHGIGHLNPGNEEERFNFAQNSIEFNLKNYPQIYNRFEKKFLKKYKINKEPIESNIEDNQDNENTTKLKETEIIKDKKNKVEKECKEFLEENNEDEILMIEEKSENKKKSSKNSKFREKM